MTRFGEKTVQMVYLITHPFKQICCWWWYLTPSEAWVRVWWWYLTLPRHGCAEKLHEDPTDRTCNAGW